MPPIHTLPGHAPARRVLSSTTATEEQRQAAEGLLWEQSSPRRLTHEELEAIGMYDLRHPRPMPDDDDNRGPQMLGLLILVAAVVIAVAIGLRLAGWV